MKADQKTNAARNPAKLKTDKPKFNGKATGKKPDRAVARTKTGKGQLSGTKKVTRRAQEELMGTRQRLVATYEYAPIGIVECSLEGKHINVNKEFCRLTGYDKEELLTLSINDLTYEEDYIFDIKLHQRLVAGQIPYYKLEKRYVRKDGEIIWVELTRNVVRDSDGKALFTIGAALDVTERKRAEQVLTEYARQQKALYELADQLHHTKSLEDVFRSALDAILGALQCDRASILLFDDTDVMRFVAWRGLSDEYRQATEGHSPWTPDAKAPEPVSFDDIRAAELSDSLKAVIQGEGIGSLAFIPLVSNEKLIGKFMVYFNGPHLFSQGELDLGLTIARQLASGIDRRRAEEKLRDSEARYRAVVEGQAEMLCRFQRDGTILFVNAAYARARDATPEALIGQDFWKFVAEEDRPAVRAMLDRLTPDKPEVRIENRFQTVDGERWTLWTNRALRFDADGHWLESQSSGIDITDRKRAEEKLRASEALYRTIARSIPGGGVYVVDKDFRYLIAEGPVTKAFGLSREMLEGHTVLEAFPDERGQRMEERLRRTFAGETVGFETKHNGRVYWTQQAPLVDSLGHAIIVTLDITERKQAEEALRESEERFVRFMQYLPGLAWIKDLQGRYVYANDAAEKAFKRPREKLYGKTDQDVFPPQVAEQFRKNDERALVDGNGVQVIETLEHEDGVLHYSLVSKFPIPGPDGKPALIGGTAFDITESRQAEEALRVSEERYRSLFELVPVAVYTCDAEGLIQEFNHRAVELWGREPNKNDPREKYCGSFKIYYPDGRLMPHEECPMSRVLRGETLEPHELEILVERPDGMRRNVIAHPLPVKNERGEIVSAINCLYDITERKQAEDALQELNLQLESRVQRRTAKLQAANQALRESEATARLILDTAPDAVVITDEAGLIVRVNAQIESLFGYQPDEVLGKPIETLIPERFHKRHSIHRRSYGTKRYRRTMGVGMELFGRRKDSSEFPVDVMLTPMSTVTGWDVMVTIRDITERKRMEQALHESRERLQILSRRLVEVQEEERRAIARELHDRVGQTLAALNISLIIMSDQLLEDSRQRIGSRMEDSLKLVAETIALVRNVMTDLRPAVLDDYGLEAALQSYIDEYKSRYGIRAILDPSGTEIPRLDPGLEMTLLRIGQEALTNVVRHAQAKQVSVFLRLEDHSICLTVHDDGIGIASLQEANHPTSHGLKIMRERAEAFGGIVNIESAPGKGTKVEARIPIEHSQQRKALEEMQ